MEHLNLLDLSPDEISALCVSAGEKPYRGRQVAAWIFRRGVSSFGEMSDISKTAREKLAALAEIRLPKVLDLAEDDHVKKILWELHDGHSVESVLIREKDHFTLCLSSQVGCALACRFCRTGTLGFTRNLSSGEILGQIIGAKKLLSPGEELTNLVFMGMGEPLLNRENLVKSLAVITDSD